MPALANQLSKAEKDALLRSDLYGFIMQAFLELNPTTEFSPNWHIEVIASELEKCRRGETKRLIINVPPRSLKSHCASIVFPAWLLGHNPSAQIICASYGQELANKLAADCRSLMVSDFYKVIFPATRLSSLRKPEFVTTNNGVRFATSVNGTLTGRGADFLIVDDPLKPDEALSDTQRKTVNDWFDHTLFSRLNDKRNGCIIVIMQRLHEDDFVGHLIEQGGWKLLRFPAIAEEDEVHAIETIFGQETFTRKAGVALHPDREPIEFLEALKGQIGEYNFAGQYQQSPSPLGGGLIKREWFQTYVSLPEKFEVIFQSWDTANKATELSDYCVCTTWGVKRKALYLLHVLRRRMEYPELKRMVRSQAADYGANNVIIEDKASGTQLIQELIHEGVRGVTKYAPKMDKIQRLSTASNLIENGAVFLPGSAPWLSSYIHELLTFPNGKHDDQADSTSQALDWYKSCNYAPGMGFFHYLRFERMKILRREGRLAEFQQLEDEYGPLEE
jgi:predicted phage terminase large subunit-like protein